MSLKGLLQQYPDRGLQSNQGDPDFRRSVWAPFFENLHQGKVIYRERFICLARIEGLKLDERGVRGTVVPLQVFFTYPGIVPPAKPWYFGGSWARMMQLDGALAQPYAGWTIWPEAGRLRAVEHLLENGDPEGALELIL